jgi:lipoprotein-releasing system permease protein
MALIVALAITNGFRNTLQRNLLGATAHINIVEKEPQYGIENWRDLIPRLRKLPHVSGAAPTLYGAVFLAGPLQSKGAILKGIDLSGELAVSDVLRRLKQGSLDGLRGTGRIPGIVLGSRLAQDTGMLPNAVLTVVFPQGELTPFGPQPSYRQFRVAGIFESGFYDFDANWAYASLEATQRGMSLKDVVNAIELRLDDLNRAPEVARASEAVIGPKLTATTWLEQNKQLLNALRMEKAVTTVTIGLIVLVGALNILITLIMMVMERYRDIAILMSMGARKEQIRNIFIFEGVIIGALGTAAGLIAGYTICHFADKYHWIRLDETVYSLSFVPFEPRPLEGLLVASAALLISLLATIYPARSATRIAPAEVLRYE